MGGQWKAHMNFRRNQGRCNLSLGVFPTLPPSLTYSLNTLTDTCSLTNSLTHPQKTLTSSTLDTQTTLITFNHTNHSPTCALNDLEPLAVEGAAKHLVQRTQGLGGGG